jgi:hypothetical protein
MSFQDFQKAPNRLTQRDIGFLIVAAILVLLVLYILVATNNYLANLWPEGGEFLLLRTGGRAFLFDRVEPYSGAVPATVQEQVYGHPVGNGEDAYILNIPFYLLIVFFPLALFPEVLVTRVFWLALSEIALVGFLYLSFRLIERRIPVIFIGLIIVSGISSYYMYLSLFEGSPVFLLGLAIVGILVALKSGHDEFAGALMVLAGFQLEIGGPFLIFVALWVYWEKRWRVFAGLGMLATVLLVISFLWYPGWVLPFLRAAWNSLRMGFGFSTHDILVQHWPSFGNSLSWFVSAGIILTLGFEWFTVRGKNFNHFLWTACLTLALTPLLGQHVEMEFLFPLTLPIILLAVISRERWKKLGDGVSFLLLWCFSGLPWLLEIHGAPEWIGLEKGEALFLFWPVFAVIGLYWIRWWMIRPPRTWLDHFALKDSS